MLLKILYLLAYVNKMRFGTTYINHSKSSRFTEPDYLLTKL